MEDGTAVPLGKNCVWHIAHIMHVLREWFSRVHGGRLQYKAYRNDVCWHLKCPRVGMRSVVYRDKDVGCYAARAWSWRR